MTNVRKGGLAVVLIVCLVAVLINIRGAHSSETDSLSIEVGSAGIVEQQILHLADKVIGSNSAVRDSFAAELLEIYGKAEDSDFVVYYYEGGWGSRPLSVDPEGRSLVTGIQSELTQLGYTYCTADYPRSHDNLGDYLFEGKELFTGYPVKSGQLAAKINFLTQQIDDLRILIVGKSTGATFVNAAAKKLETNSNVYNIQIGNPAGHCTPVADRSLSICSNGIEEDAMAEISIWSAFKANKIKMILIGCAPSFTPVGWILGKAFLGLCLCTTDFALKIPGHEYMWYYPNVGSRIEAFLVEAFGSR